MEGGERKNKGYVTFHLFAFERKVEGGGVMMVVVVVFVLSYCFPV